MEPSLNSTVGGLKRLTGWSPLYEAFLDQRPRFRDWILKPENHEPPFGKTSLRSVWEKEILQAPADSVSLDLMLPRLREFRRLMSLRIAYREINDLASVPESLTELTQLAEFCLGIVLDACLASWIQRLGQPWDDRLDRPARFCVVGLGKFGGGELNFCSDLDLMFLYEGDGACRKDGHSTSAPSQEFYARLCRDLSGRLNQRSADGFLYNIDLRLRPEGDSGPLIRSLTSMEHYYYVAGQTWERLALMKARAVAGDLNLGAEFFESINPFRYPRHPPSHLLESIGGVKLRIEREVVGPGELERNIKNGPGGIREIEFFIQALQMLEGGRNPFLQAAGTMEALEKLERYAMVEPGQAAFLRRSYYQLRRLENLLQIREEKQTHLLPADLDHPAFARLADITDFKGTAEFRIWLDSTRQAIRKNYGQLFPETPEENETQEWTLMLSGQAPSPPIDQKLRHWFGDEAPAAPDGLRRFVLGDSRNVLTRELVVLFRDLSRCFDHLLPRLSSPLEALAAVSAFGKSYGAPKQFFKACAGNPNMFEALSLLFDRSQFVFQLLKRHPEIIEEVLGPTYGSNKTVEDHRREIRQLPRSADFPKWLWLYVKAEQVRLAIRDLLDGASRVDVTRALTVLAEATLAETLDFAGFDGSDLLIVGLGKLAGGELTFGSDLDVIFLGRSATDTAAMDVVKGVVKTLSHNESLGPIYDVDTRLRPYGADGPVVTTRPALERYHDGGGGQFWERFAMTRARPLTGDPALFASFGEFLDEMIFRRPVSAEQLATLGTMRERIEQEKGAANPGEFAFKAGRGGLIDIEFLIQRYQVTHGGAHPDLREPNTARALEKLAAHGCIDPGTADQLIRHFNFLRRLEYVLRRFDNTGASVLTESRVSPVACWMKFPDTAGFLETLRATLESTRKLVKSAIRIPTFPG